MSRSALPIIGLTGAASFLLGLVASSSRPAEMGGIVGVRQPVAAVEPLVVSTSPPVAPSVEPAAGGPGVDFASVAASLNAAVVNVDAAARGSDDRSRLPRWRRDLGDDEGAPREGSGCGFIIDPTGYILTNHHVVDGADRITVTLGDGRSFTATVVGVDPAIDVALLHISARDPLPVAPLGDSDTLRVGEWVCAIGNPLGYVHSVTVGVVSFLGRKLFDPSLDAFIQTDAAISFGNSGGPLINRHGQVVGITTAISAQASNIGFAIPISQVMDILPQLQTRGRVSRGYIGVGLTNLSPSLRRALGFGPAHGALVQDITADMPAERAGLRAYDLVTGADGQPIASDDELIRHISARQPGTVARLQVWRDGTTREFQVKLGERPPTQTRTSPADLGVRPAVHDDAPLGLKVREIRSADRPAARPSGVDDRRARVERRPGGSCAPGARRDRQRRP